MRMLKRNLTKFEYYGYTGLETDLDENGLHTGEFIIDNADPVTYYGNISVPSGAAIQSFDGLDIRYTHILLMDDPNVNIHENGYIVWKNKTYDITAVRPSLNVMSIALHQRTEDNGDQPIDGEDESENDDGQQAGD